MTSENLLARAGLRLASGQGLPDLRIVGRVQVHLHEDCDPGRVNRLVTRLRADGVLRHPPLAAAIPDGDFVVLDGANRTSALLALDSPVVPLQVVDYADPSVRLEVWHHLLVRPIDLPARLQAKGLALRAGSPAEAARWLAERTIACYVLTPSGAMAVPLSPDRVLAEILSVVVDAYKGTNQIYRVTDTRLDTLARQYGAVGELVVFPTFSKGDILETAHAPMKLPTGITRHLLPGRALRVNLPLAVLTAPGDIEQKNRWLADEIHRKLLEHQIRYYPEATFLFDE
jgi:hypothetical protein